MSIKSIAKETGILEPNIRRILGEGTKSGEFSRVAKGIYKVITDEGATGIFKLCDALEEIKNIDEKFDMIFLDIPYKTKAVIGGSRGVKYSLISNKEFSDFLVNLKKVLKNKNTPIYHMFSNAPSGMKEMMNYNKEFENNGYKKVDYGEWKKLFKNGKVATNMRGNIMPPEGIALYSLSGEVKEKKRQMDFTLSKTNIASQKPVEMLKTLINQSSKKFDLLFDPFAGSGVFGKTALELSRNVISLELSGKRFYNETII